MVNSVSATILDRRYRLEELLGAVKILSLQHLNDWKQLERSRRSAVP
jgi:hypothetical protein